MRFLLRGYRNLKRKGERECMYKRFTSSVMLHLMMFRWGHFKLCTFAFRAKMGELQSCIGVSVKMQSTKMRRSDNTIPPLPMQLRTLTFAPLYFRVHPNKMTSEAEDEILKIYFQQLFWGGGEGDGFKG